MSTILSKHFIAEDFVPKEIITNPKLNPRWFVRKSTIDFAEFLNTTFTEVLKTKGKVIPATGKVIVVNNYTSNGALQFRGLRTPACTEGASNSQHRFMNAFDFNVTGLTSDEVYDYIIANEKMFMDAGLTTVEDKSMTKGWTHVDFRWTDLTHLLIVKP